ncbi:MAG TPA: matrixin family metalloprotease [Nitrososphaera sp.]|nr:matrixin family metalloprotease [Nitrososphaera sp.]
MYLKLSLFALAAAFLVATLNISPALAARYYADQTNFAEDSVPAAEYSWDQDAIDGCIYRDDGVKNSYYVWAKMAVQKWRQALREYTDNQDAWSFSVRYVRTQAELESCDVKFYIYDTYKDFPDYPAQTGAYTIVKFSNIRGDLDARVYLAPQVLHGDGETEIDLPTYAFRNSAVHEVGHVLGLGHMQSEKGYLMSPQFDFFEQDDQLPITTLELDALTEMYGNGGFG